MDLSNKTRKQHFISQTEQRLNAYVGEKIYEFCVTREGATSRLSAPVSRPIEKNLHLEDLFSFDVQPNEKLRENFETLFKQYEDSLASLSINVLEKVTTGASITKDELEQLFAAKLMSFARNPYSVEKVLNSFAPFLQVVPLEPGIRDLYDKVLKGKKPHQEYLCKQLGISDVMYRDWLTVLFMLLVPLPKEQSNFLNLITRNGFQSPDTFLGVLVSSYSSESVLLSDRAATLAQLEGSELFEFNLSKSAFVRYQFFNRAFMFEGLALPSNMGAYVDQIMAQREPIFLRVEHDSFELLRAYNANAIEHSYQRVFCASKTPMY